jgi:hypothetical protein
MFLRLSPVLSLNHTIINYYAYFLNYLGAFAHEPFLYYINYLSGEYRRNYGDISFFLKDTASYGLIRP